MLEFELGASSSALLALPGPPPVPLLNLPNTPGWASLQPGKWLQ